jgi:RNA polymerase-binding transcription factor DksA
MNQSDIEKFKERLVKEKSVLEAELGGIAVKTPRSIDEESTWQAKQTLDDDSTKADPNEVADKIEEYETNESIIKNLQTQLKEVNDALERIEKGTYGICELSGHQIETDRLEANPSARTCKEHMND